MSDLVHVTPGGAAQSAKRGEPRRSLVLKRPPLTDDELWQVVKTIWGMEIPRTRVCPNHKAPFEAFADAYFARSTVSVWKASRGFGGKSRTLALLGNTEAVLLRAEVNILGGSSAQSLNVHEAMTTMWDSPLAPTQLVRKSTQFETVFMGNARIRALMASQKSVRGPHPQRLRLDEIDEMEWAILEASLGQPMSTDTITAQTVMSSTHQYPDGTMSRILKRAEDVGWPIFEWCWKETAEPHGWLTLDDIARKRQTVSAEMWRTEYDLQEPSFEGRAIDTHAVEDAYDKNVAMVPGDEGRYYEFQEPKPRAKYVTGVDWAKERDWTVIRTWRTDCDPWEEVAFEKLGRRPWPIMVARLNTRGRRFPGIIVHDATGIGGVVDDYMEVDSNGVILTSRLRSDIFNDYIAALENRLIRSPRIEWAFNEHKYVTNEDLFGKGHPPDSFVAGALAWYARGNKPELTMPLSMGKASAWRL